MHLGGGSPLLLLISGLYPTCGGNIRFSYAPILKKNLTALPEQTLESFPEPKVEREMQPMFHLYS